MIELGGAIVIGSSRHLHLEGPEGHGEPWEVPPGRVLVVQSAIINPLAPTEGLLRVTLWRQRAAAQYWSAPSDRSTYFEFTPGMVIRSGTVLRIEVSPQSSSEVYVSVFGYLASAD